MSSEVYQGDYEHFNGKNIVVTYSAILNNEAPNAGVLNYVEVNSQNAVAKDQTTITYGGFSFTKTDATGSNLTGAKFAIKKVDGTYLKQENGLWKAVDDAKDSARGGDVDEDGVETATFTYNGLADGAYTVEETETPTGYMSNAKVTFKVTIRSISQLPLTGGAGVALFTIVGLLLIGAGAAVHLKNRDSARALRY